MYNNKCIRYSLVTLERESGLYMNKLKNYLLDELLWAFVAIG